VCVCVCVCVCGRRVSRGLDFAQTAKETGNIDDERRWLGRAMVCFDSAHNADMCRRARAHMQSLVPRSKVRQLAIDYHRGAVERGLGGVAMELEEAVEVEAMRAVRACMVREAVELCQHLVPHLASRSRQLLSSDLLHPLIARLPLHSVL